MIRGAGETEGLGALRRPLVSPAVLLVVWIALVPGCASPVAPSGGPEDRTPPALETAEPEAGAVNVRAERLVLTFSEPVDERAAAQALSIAPAWATPPEVRARGRRLEVTFPDSLRAQTTYVVTFDTNLRDLRGVALTQPITIAFATGPQLDRGRIEGRVLDPGTGAVVASIDVFAYRLPGAAATDSLALDSLGVPLPDPTTDDLDYRTQTGADGRFTLDYLRPGPFFVVAIADGNRNRQADAGEAYAVPFESVAQAREPDSARTIEPLRYFRTRLDTIPPVPTRIRTRSARRLAVRFDEPIVLRDREPMWALVDTTTGSTATVRSVYADDDPQQLVLFTDSLPPTPHRLWLTRPEAVADSAGNAALPDTLAFTPSTEPDTLQTRFLGFIPDGSRQVQADSAGVRFSAPPDSAARARIAATDTLGTALDLRLTSRDGRRYWIVPETYEPFRLSVREPDSIYVQTFTPLSADERGELAGVVTGAASPVFVEVTAGATRIVVQAETDGTFRISGLPEGEVSVRAFADRNGNGRWDGGRLVPYVPPEPLVFLERPPSIRPRWETVADTFALE